MNNEDNMNNGDKTNMLKYFPYVKVREPQTKIIQMTHKFLHTDEYDGMVLCAASGIGKESCMTSQALLALEEGLFEKIIFVIPTDSGKENILKEFGAVHHHKKIIKIFSKDVLCNWIKDTSDERISAIEEETYAFQLCRLQGHKCKYKERGCHYIEQKDEIQSADILICDYNYIFSPVIRRASGFDEILKCRTLLLIDECHMLRKRAEMILTNSISSNTINRVLKELDTYGFSQEKEIVQNILKQIKKEASANYSRLKYQMQKSHDGFGEMVLKYSTMQKFCGLESENIGERLAAIGEDISDMKFEKKEGIISYSEVLGDFILRFYKIYKDNAVFFLKLKDDMETMHIGWTPIDVRGFIRNSIKKANKYILYSGTCKPMKLKNDLGLSYERVYTPNPLESPYLNNRKDIILTKERFCDDNLNQKPFSERIIKDLHKLLSKMSAPIGIVCTNQLYEKLNLSSTFQILDQPETQEDVEHWLNNLVPKAQLIRFSPYGRVAQSIDLSYLKSIIFLGFPYQRYDPITEEKIHKLCKSFKGKTGNRKSRAFYVQMVEPAYERIVQSVMRGLRNENDRLSVIYYDVNYKLNKPALGSKNLIICDTIKDVIGHLSN